MNRAMHHTAGEHRRCHSSGTAAKAICIALRFRGNAPTVKQLQDAYGMSRATAYRWRNAFLDAIGAP